MTRVEGQCDPRNQASIATARRLGFTYEGTHRKAFYLDGEHRDVQSSPDAGLFSACGVVGWP
jgi:ribosomal-protein-serine acetyltransferase